MRPCEGGSRCQRPLVRRTLTPGRSSPVRHRTNAVRRSSSARAVRREADAAEPRGVTATYLRACARCGCPPDPGVAADLSEHGALIVDLRLCTAEALHAVCALLREGPAGVRQIVLRDGLASLGSDVAYREKAYAHRKRGRTLLKPKQASMCSCGHAAVDGAEFCTKCGKKRPKDDPPPLDAAPLRLLVAALACFLAGRGAKLEVLDLAGMPLGREVPTLLSPLAVALRNARLRELRWLGLSGCRLSDRGLGLLLPWLAGADNFLPRLEGLALAWNGFSDVRLVDALIRARARLCYERRAAPLRLLDLSGNPRLCEVGAPSTPAAVTPASISARRRGGTGVAPRLGANAPGKASAQGCPKRRAALIRSISCALAEGLPLRVLRLRRMRLDDEVLQPLLQLMQAETRRCVVSAGALAGASGFCMEEVDLEGNQLDDEFLEAVADCLRLLGAVRECPLSSAAPDPFPPARTMEHQSNASQPIGDTIPPAAQEVQRRSQSGATHNGAAIGLRRAASCPASPQFERTPTTAPSPDDAAAIAAVAAISGGSSAQLLSPVTAALLTRDALSDVGESQGDLDADGEDGIPRPCLVAAAYAVGQAVAASREAFLLKRAEDRRSFRGAAAALASRRPRRPQQVARPPEPDPQAIVEPEIAIAGVLGPRAAQSIVRQTILAELQASNTPATVEAAATCGAPCIAVEPGARHRFPSAQEPAAPMRPAFIHEVRTRSHEVMSGDAEYEESEEDTSSEREAEAVEEILRSSQDIADDEEAEQAAAELLRAERLEALRADVLGALSPLGGVRRHQDAAARDTETGADGAAWRHARQEGEPQPDGLGGWGPPERRQLDDMHIEALKELCSRMRSGATVANGGAGHHDEYNQTTGDAGEGWSAWTGGWPRDPRAATGG